MPPSLTDTLCTRCGLCCDGSLFADVELAGRAELARLELLAIEFDDDGATDMVLSQPCSALKGRRCTIYTHRPGSCRAFECRLLQDARRGAVSVERAGEHIAEALKRIGHVKALLTQLGQRDQRLPLKERCAEALAVEDSADAKGNRERAELEAAMSSVERWISRRFMG